MFVANIARLALVIVAYFLMAYFFIYTSMVAYDQLKGVIIISKIFKKGREKNSDARTAVVLTGFIMVTLVTLTAYYTLIVTLPILVGNLSGAERFTLLDRIIVGIDFIWVFVAHKAYDALATLRLMIVDIGGEDEKR